MNKNYFPGLRTMEHTELLPFFFPEGTVTKQIAAYDPSGSNNAGNFETAYIRYIDDNGEFVIFDEYGPGCLYRQQINVWGYNGYPEAGKARIKYYFDSETTPRIDMPIDEFFGGKVSPFDDPFSFIDTEKRFAMQYYPFSFKTRLKVTTTMDFNKLLKPYSMSWYQYTYIVFPQDYQVETWKGTGDDSEIIRRQWNNVGTDPKDTTGNIPYLNSIIIGNGCKKTIFEVSDKGSLSSIKLKINPFSKATFFNVNLRIYWDDLKEPAVDMPLGSFFGSGGNEFKCTIDPKTFIEGRDYGDFNATIGEKQLKTLFFGFDGRTGELYCYWPMPFWTSVRIEIVNKSGVEILVDYDIQYKPSAEFEYELGQAGYFHAKRTIDSDTGDELFINAYEESGRGHIVGMTFFTTQYAMDGGEFTYIDGSRTPQIHGSGTEDDHNQGWAGDNYQKPLWGGLINGYQGAYRIYMNDSYIFYNHIESNYEFSRDGGVAFGGKSDVVVYYYKSKSGNGLELTDKIDIGNPVSEKVHQYLITGQTWEGKITSGYDGYERDYEYDVCTDFGRGFRGTSSFVVNIDADNKGIKLRRRLSRISNGIQKAAVYIDGFKLERPWYTCTLSTAPAYQAWMDDDYEIPSVHTFGKSEMKITIEYLDSTNKTDINEFYYWVYTYKNCGTESIIDKVKGIYASDEQTHKISLKWDASDEKYRIKFYKIYRSNNTDFSAPICVGISDDTCFIDWRVAPASTYYYKVSAVDIVNKESLSSNMICVSTGVYNRESIAEFVCVDKTTSGNWGGVYGTDGFTMLKYFHGRDCNVYPRYLSSVDCGNMQGRQFSVFSYSTEVSLMTSPISYSIRHLGGLCTDKSDEITLNINDDETHQIALYFCDYDRFNCGRNQEVEILDMCGNIICQKQNLFDFSNGLWLKYNVRGSVKIRIINKNVFSNAVISAIMFDPIDISSK